MLNTKFSPWPSYTSSSKLQIKLITGLELNVVVLKKNFAQYTDCSFAVAVSNGTLALDLAFASFRYQKW